ncbi:MAG: DMT family transporter [Bacteroidota bacterium]|nr:DMT family transporter [Bacteroidota bacterium]
MTTRNRAELFLFATTFIWGSTFVVVKAGSENISSSLFIALRFGIGALLFAIFLFKQLNTITFQTLKKSVILGLMLGVGILLQNYGIYNTTASKSAFITGLMVIFTPIAQLIIERKSPKIGNLIGIVIVTLGLYLLTSPSDSGINFGDVLVFVSALIFGVFIVYLDIFSKTENVLHLAFLQVTIVTLIAIMVVPFETRRFIPSTQLILSLLYMGICATVFTTYIQTRFQKDTTPTRAVIIFTIEPVIAAVLAYFVLGELLGPVGIIGASLIIVGILVSEFFDSFISKLFFKNLTVEN